MHSIDTANAVGTLPTPAAPGTPGYFGNGTIVDPDWLNAVQGEIEAPVLLTGTALSKTSNAQMMAALAVIFGTPPVWVFSTANVTVPAWATRALVDAWGGGGAGGYGITYPGAGGSGGGWGQSLFTGLTGGASINVVIGVGGTPTGATGSAGSSTSFNGTVIATGGSGGGPGSGSGVGVNSGSPGTGVGHATQAGVQGQGGQNGIGSALGGMGGSAPFGGAPTINPATTGGVPGNVPGGGGSGSAGGGTDGGAGASGAAMILWLP